MANDFNIRGLTTSEVQQSAAQNGYNTIAVKKENRFWEAVKDFFKEPMTILLIVAATIYFISGDVGDGLFLVVAIILISTISLYQESRSRKALEQLKALSQPHCKVIRDNEIQEINSDDLVLGDFLLVEEGTAIPADGKIVQSNDFSVNESILTGESLSVEKDTQHEDPFVYQGTTVVSGLAIVQTTAIAANTRLGKIGQSLESIKEEKTPLELQINNFVKKMAVIGIIIFLIVWGINYYSSHNISDSLLKALTLAMSILPEEIPVAFTTFMALGAWRLMKMNIVVKQMKTVETLGGATVICTDKTGTITENKMSLVQAYVLKNNEIENTSKNLSENAKQLIAISMWASEPVPFDPMEIALHKAYSDFISNDLRSEYKMVHEYPLGGKPPMMTHLFENEQGESVIAAKGAPEAIIAVSNLSESEKKSIQDAMHLMAKEGYRILGVGQALFEGHQYPKTQQKFLFEFIGLVAFADPPKKNIGKVFQQFYDAGIKVKIVTGDNAATTTAIAKQIHFKGHENSITGDELMLLSDAELEAQVNDTDMFTRMFPDAKLRIIDALKSNKEIVAMTGDGVNDGPALKSAHIGIAMGKKGTEIAKQAASLVLLDDDFSKMIDAVAMGRKIYANLKKAIQFIISIHIPIILTVFIPLALGWLYPNIFTPVHVIFLELIMGPTCSIVYENEPMEANTMQQSPRPYTTTFFNLKELTTSIIQGLFITAGTLLMYQYAVQQGFSEDLTRTLVFTTLIAANIVLTLVNRSFFYSLFTTLRYKNNLVGLIIGATILLTASLIYIKPLAMFFGFEALSLQQVALCIVIGFISVYWFEIIKGVKRSSAKL